jgi:hypothetical protein
MPQFEYLVKRQRYYGYTIMFNINICHNNMDDVKELTEIARSTTSRRTITSTRRR